jgi:hypothetical protein
MITDRLIPRLKERFPNQGMTFGLPPKPSVVIAPAHPDFGDVQIFDEGEELTLVVVRFTHDHFSGCMSQSVDEAEQYIVDDVIEFLERLFADQIVMWGTHRGGGGWRIRESSAIAQIPDRNAPLFVWSGPLVRKQ